MPSLTHAEAVARAALITVESYELDLDLTTGADGFRSVTTVRFRAERSSADPGATTFVELRPARLISATLNGRRLDPAGLVDNRLPLPALAAGNELVVEAEMAYANSGEGLHRFVDPADGAVYLYQMSFLDHAQRMFACFDQPDLKAPVTLAVTAPADWLVAANAPEADAPEPVDVAEPADTSEPVDVTATGAASDAGGAARRWRFAPTRPLATYLVTLIAGPYHVVTGEHDRVPLALYCRRSLADHLDADAGELLELTAACLDRYHDLFGVRYPFDKYGQAFVPEFNMGAMENPGLVTFRDDNVFRSAVTDTERERRATTLAHEMAHMWFGDLVTMRWWDDLWLNESFADYLGVRVAAEATRHRHTWTTFAIRQKAWAYAADQRPSTHPVAPERVADTAEALLNFDGISYAKGASVLRQLVATLGDEVFLSGLREYFTAYRFGNATLADLLAKLGAAAGHDLTGWAEIWLRRAQLNTLRPEVRIDADGRYEAVSVRQTAPSTHPTLRPHQVQVAVYDLDGGAAVRRLAVPAVVAAQPLSMVPALAGEPAGDLLLVNDADLTYAKVRLDAVSMAALPRVLAALDDPLARAILWSVMIDSVRDAEVPVDELVALTVTALPSEDLVPVVEDVLTLTGDLVDRFAVPGRRPALLDRLGHGCELLLSVAEPGGSGQLAAARALIRTAVTGDARSAARLAGWLAGDGVPEGLPVDAELRWRLRYRQAVLGLAGEAEIAAELAADRSATGQQWAARCRAALPDEQAKARAWETIVADTTMSGRLLEATASGFWQPEQTELTGPYVERYVVDMPGAARRRTPLVAETLAKAAFPRVMVAEATRDAAGRLLARDDLESGLRRAVVDAADELVRALTARRRFGPA